MVLKGKDAKHFEQEIAKNIKQSIDFTEQVKISKKILEKALSVEPNNQPPF